MKKLLLLLALVSMNTLAEPVNHWRIEGFYLVSTHENVRYNIGSRRFQTKDEASWWTCVSLMDGTEFKGAIHLYELNNYTWVDCDGLVVPLHGLREAYSNLKDKYD